MYYIYIIQKDGMSIPALIIAAHNGHIVIVRLLWRYNKVHVDQKDSKVIYCVHLLCLVNIVITNFIVIYSLEGLL